MIVKILFLQLIDVWQKDRSQFQYLFRIRAARTSALFAISIK